MSLKDLYLLGIDGVSCRLRHQIVLFSRWMMLSSVASFMKQNCHSQTLNL